ncbi:MAG: thiamine-phosphate kinase [Elusimicrobia bacterium CG08_land_8_20_14_0_20_51_18]|nr:MAG: thiamine-phosphate kinase [Elusimicrobia bacterium CG08_land_8_20_14_0_20_51_18]
MKSEYGLIEYFSRVFKPLDKKLLLGPGDDCAVFDLGGKKALLLTTDEMVEGAHFLMRFSSPELIAAKLVRMNVSDIYSMGAAKPAACLVSSGLNGRLPRGWVERFARALKRESLKFGMSVAGGNLARARELHFSMTVIGFAEKKRIVRRTGASPGDLVYSLGTMGGSRAGLELLVKNLAGGKPGERLKNFFWRPPLFPREARLLSGFATSMLDNSDGLYKSLGLLSGLNGVKVRVELSERFADKALLSWCAETKKDWRKYALAGGEDYGLLFTVSPGNERRLKNTVPACYKVGEAEKGKGVFIEGYDGKIEAFEHF